MGKSLNRQNESRPQIRAACDRLSSWRKLEQKEQAKAEAARRAAEEEAREQRLQQARSLGRMRRSRAGPLGAEPDERPKEAEPGKKAIPDPGSLSRRRREELRKFRRGIGRVS